MCGFAGFTNVARSPVHYVDDVHRMLRAIAHRGRDEMGYYVDDSTALATVRLAIIDLRMGKQPMSSPDRRYWIGFNGEIFNYLELRSELEATGVRFRTASDTEVLCQALVTWGEHALPKLNGQFGFAFHDRLTGRVLLGRDRFGERPVFYTRHGDGLLFASEVKGLFALPYVRRALSPEGLRQTYRGFAPLPGATPFEDVWSLPPGHCAVFEGGQLGVFPYYAFPQPQQPAFSDAGEASEAIRSALAEGVRLRLRSDYEVGAFISGGIDSAAVASIARSAGEAPLRTFSAVMEDPRIDESNHQQLVVDALGTDHTAVTVTGADVRRVFPEVVHLAEAPLFRTAAVVCYRLAEATHDAGMRVVLSGEGSDELFLGYDIFKEAWLLQNFDSFADDAARATWLDNAFSDARTTKAIDSRAVVAMYQRMRDDADGSVAPHLRRFGDEGSGAEFLVADPPPGRWEDDLVRAMCSIDPGFETRTNVQKAQLVDIATLLSGYGLSYQWDKAGMRYQVETRFPFLDPAVVDVAWSIAEDLRLPNGHSEKDILKKAFAPLVPPGIVKRSKQALRAPGAEHLRRNGSDDWVAAAVSEDRLARSSIVDPVSARRLIKIAHRDARPIPYPANHGYALLLSTLLLEEHLVDAFRLPDVDVEAQLVRRVDERTVVPSS